MTEPTFRTPVLAAEDERDDFPQPTKDLLAKRAGYMCAFPGCRRLTIGPSEDRATQTTMVGVAAHITAASPRGPRYDPSLSSEERSSERNGVWACQTHAKLIDDNPSRHTVEEIARWKKQHEEWVFARVSNADNHIKNGVSWVRLKEVGPFADRMDVKLGRHNVVYGPNGSGKSTLCEAIAAFAGGPNYDRFATRWRFCRGSPRETMIEAVASVGDAATAVSLRQQALAVRHSKGSPPPQRLHVEINGNVAPSWPRALFNVVLLNEATFRSRSGPKDPLAHAIRFIGEQIGIDEQNIWDSLDPQLFVTSTFGFRVKRRGKQTAEFLVPDGRDFYLPFTSLSSSEQVRATLDILLKTLRADPRNPPWLLALDAEFFGRLSTGAKQYVFDTLKSHVDVPVQTIFCVTFENDVEALKAAADDTWIGAASAGNLTVHTFL